MTNFAAGMLLQRFEEVEAFFPLSLVVTGGPLTDTYQLAIIRFRWGHDNNSGSEHAINDQNYPLEVIHFTIKEDASLLSVDYSEKGFFKFTSLSISSAVFFPLWTCTGF